MVRIVQVVSDNWNLFAHVIVGVFFKVGLPVLNWLRNSGNYWIDCGKEINTLQSFPYLFGLISSSGHPDFWNANSAGYRIGNEKIRRAKVKEKKQKFKQFVSVG